MNSNRFSITGFSMFSKQNDLNNPPGKSTTTSSNNASHSRSSSGDNDSGLIASLPIATSSNGHSGSSQAHDELTVREILSSLFPPFRETGPVLLAQIDALIQKEFGGKLERFLNSFLLQAKPVLQWIRDDAKNALLNRECCPAILPEGMFKYYRVC